MSVALLKLSTSPGCRFAAPIVTVALARLPVLTSLTVMPASSATAAPPPAKTGDGVPTVMTGAAASSPWLNSEVSPVTTLVAVAVTNSPSATLADSEASKTTLPLLFVVTVAKPRRAAPSTFPLESGPALAKNSMRNVLSGVLLNVPSMMTCVPEVLTSVRTEALC